MPESFALIPFLNFALLALLQVIETGLRRSRPELYYKIGIPILRRNLSTISLKKEPLTLGFLPEYLKASGFIPRIEIHHLNDLTCGLWVPLVQRRYASGHIRNFLSLTHGYIVLDTKNKVLKLRVFLNWFTPFFILVGFSFLFFPSALCIGIGISVIWASLLLFRIFKERERHLVIWNSIQKYSFGRYSAGKIKRIFS